MKNDYRLGQKLLWIVRDFDTTADISAVVTEVYNDHVIAKTTGNEYENYNDMPLWIDEHTEQDFRIIG